MRPPPVGGGYADDVDGNLRIFGASMRPPPVGGGYRQANQARQAASEASMRPPPVGGGYSRCLGTADKARPRFNEAAARGRRILDLFRRFPGYGSQRLQ